MSNPVDPLKQFVRKIGWQPGLFLTLAFITVTFAGQLSADSGLVKQANLLAGGLFVLGVLLALLRLVSTYFTRRPARGLIDGLAAGLLAGLIGGMFGYGWHKGYYLGIEDPLYYLYDKDPAFRRIAYCTVFATPIGGVLGVILDLIHADRPIEFRKYLGAVILGVLILVVVVGFGVSAFAPTTVGPGIIVSDFQLLFECFLVFFSAILAVSLGWKWRKFLGRVSLLLIAIIAARAFTFVVPAQADGDPPVRLVMLRFPHDATKDVSGVATRLTGPNALPFVQMGITAGILMLWTLGSYALFYKDHALSRWIDRKVGERRPGR